MKIPQQRYIHAQQLWLMSITTDVLACSGGHHIFLSNFRIIYTAGLLYVAWTTDGKFFVVGSGGICQGD